MQPQRGLSPAASSSTTAERVAPRPDDDAKQQTAEAGAPPSPEPVALAGLQGRWASLPGRYKLTLATSVSFVICNMDKASRRDVGAA